MCFITPLSYFAHNSVVTNSGKAQLCLYCLQLLMQNTSVNSTTKAVFLWSFSGHKCSRKQAVSHGNCSLIDQQGVSWACPHGTSLACQFREVRLIIGKVRVPWFPVNKWKLHQHFHLALEIIQHHLWCILLVNETQTHSKMYFLPLSQAKNIVTILLLLFIKQIIILTTICMCYIFDCWFINEQNSQIDQSMWSQRECSV